MKLIPFVLAIMATSAIQAETLYISDVLYVPLRAGPGSQYRILHRGLKTGTPLEVVAPNEKDNKNENENENENESYIKVRTLSGHEGYIPAQYLKQGQPANEKLEKVLNENQELKSKNEKYRTQLAHTERNNLRTTALEQELNSIRKISANTLKINQQNKALIVSNEETKAKLHTLQAENQQLSDSTQQRWYLYGSLTLFMGVLLGLLGPLLKPMKKSNWS